MVRKEPIRSAILILNGPDFSDPDADKPPVPPKA
jgi:hypothetical protein